MGDSLQFHRFGNMCLWAVGAFALCSAVPEAAYATCGDYLMIPGETAHHMDALGEDSHADHGRQELPCPCQGPGCRAVPHAPLPTAPERSQTQEVERWFTALADAGQSAHASTLFRMEEFLLIPTGYESRIDRPPRG